MEIHDNHIFYYGANYKIRNQCSKMYVKRTHTYYISHECSGIDRIGPIYTDKTEYMFCSNPILCDCVICFKASNAFHTYGNKLYRQKLQEFLKYNSNKYNLILSIPELLLELRVIIQREFFYILTNII